MVVSRPSPAPIFDEFFSDLETAADLGHAALNKSFLRQIQAVIDSGGAPGPAMAGLGPEKCRGAMADLASFYRFVNNEKASLDAMRKARRTVTLARVDACQEPLLVVHDVTIFNFFTHDSKADRRVIGDGRALGYENNSSMAVGGNSGTMLGILHDTLVSKAGPDDTGTFDYHGDETFSSIKGKKGKAQLKANHRHQFAVHAEGLADLLGGREAIHVGDAEFDDLFIMLSCEKAQAHFVLRAKGDRLIHVRASKTLQSSQYRGHHGGHPLPQGHIQTSIERVLEVLPTHRYKTVYVNSKGRISDEPETGLRAAKLSIGTCRVSMFRTAKRNTEHFATDHPVQVNVVYIVEKNPPRGAKALQWVLYTNLPVAKKAQLHQVARYYQLRWKVEVYFRLIKSGYHIEDSRLTSAAKIARLTIINSLAAMAIVYLKEAAGLPVGGKLDDESYKRLKDAGRQIDSQEIDLPLRIVAYMARLGGWLARRGDPLGPDVLMRGAKGLAAVLHAAVNHAGFLEEVAKNPGALRGLIRV